MQKAIRGLAAYLLGQTSRSNQIRVIVDGENGPRALTLHPSSLVNICFVWEGQRFFLVNVVYRHKVAFTAHSKMILV